VAFALTWVGRVQNTGKNRRLAALAYLFLGCVACLAALGFDLFLLNDALTDLAGAKHEFLVKLPGYLHDQGGVIQSLQSMSGSDVDGKLSVLSKAIIEPPGGGEEFKRDLILTASRLPADDQAGNSVPNDLYFYYDMKAERDDPSKLPSNGDKRFISLRQNPEKLFKVVLGSSTIYPFFRAQRLDSVDVNRPDANGPSNPKGGGSEKIGRIDIVDGGFSHNSPLDAAISWGATHIILIDASPVPHYERPRTLASHAGNAFNFLFDQAQSTDTRERGKVEVFELAPSAPCDEWFDPSCADKKQKWLDLFDFAKPLLQRAIIQGGKDVAGRKPMFTRIPGPPAFVPVDDNPKAAAELK